MQAHMPMKKIITILFLIVAMPSLLNAQKVGLVMSGGGARGLAHIGVIKALEENGIPIDYVAGTSMGAIVASLYSMGFTPDEMIAMMSSDDFQRWCSGTMDQDYMFYFRKNKDVPDILNIHFNVKDSLHILKPSIHLIKSSPMNFGFMEIFSGPNTVCKGNFDSLMIPFRCVASDVYNKKQIVFSEGNLGDAVRASMTYPFFFKPIKVDSLLLYDGGLYNNFPRDVMENEFTPDFIIGSAVSDNPSLPDERDIMSQAENLIVSRSDYTMPEGKGILLDIKIKGVKLLDFHKMEEVTRKGYEHTMAMIDSIKMNVQRVQDSTLLAEKRRSFREQVPELVFNRVVVNGVTKEQERSIIREFHKNGERFSFDKCKRGYYSLLSGDLIEEIIPHAIYNEVDSAYTLHLDVKVHPSFTLKLGAGVSTSISNQIYFGVHYRNLNNRAKEFIFDGQLGKVYNNLQLSGRADFLGELPISLKFIGSYSTVDYYNMQYLFSKENSVALNHQREVFAKLKIVLPFLNRKKAEFGIGIADIKDEYMPTSIVDLDMPKFDRNDMTFFGGFLRFEGNTLDAKVFPTDGVHEALTAQFVIGEEEYEGVVKFENNKVEQSWLQIGYTRRDHFRINSKFTLGTYLHLFYSTRRLSKTYQATMMQAGSFAPTMNGLFYYDPKFRANQFVAGGITPIYKLNSYIQIRPSFYVFAPYRLINENPDGTASYSIRRFNDFQYIADLTAVASFSNLSVSAFVNFYSSHKSTVNAGISIGWFMFNERFVD